MSSIIKSAIVLLFAFSSAVFAYGQEIIINSISIEGNDKTKEQYILRELVFSTGDTISVDEWNNLREKSIQNLINTTLFHSASITLNGEGSSRNVTIILVERWYLWPIPQVDIDERNFNTWWETKSLKRASAGIFLTHNNMRGRGELLKVLMMLGYNQKIGLSYEFPYLNKKKTIGFGFESIYTLRHEVNALTDSNKQVYVKLQDSPIQQDLINAVQFTYRPKFYVSHLLQFRYRQYLFADSLIDFNPNYSSQENSKLQYFGFYYKFKLDHRDYRPYPLSGYYADLEAFKYGLGVFDNDLNILNLKTTLRKYWQLSPRWFTAIGFIGQISNGKYQPYLFERGLGYGRDFVRAYEYYVVDGQDYVVLKSNVKFSLFPKKYFKLNMIKSDKFNNIPISIYLNVFADAGYVNNDQDYKISNTLPNTLLYSSGLGIDFVSYYDAVARVEWSVNAMGESHFYLHFIAPI
jgi:outer membrane protein assembly factor BamA